MGMWHSFARDVGADTAVLQALEQGPQTRQEIAAAIGYSRSAVAIALERLEADGRVRDVAQRSRGRGRSARVFALVTP